MKMTFKFPTMTQWGKLLGQWSDFPDCAEKNLICAVISQAIYDAYKDHHLDDVANRLEFWGRGFEKYCAAIDINSDYVRKQILKAASHHMTVIEVAA